MIAALLPAMALSFRVSIAATGQLVTIFALVYALSSPVLTTSSSAPMSLVTAASFGKMPTTSERRLIVSDAPRPFWRNVR